MCLCRSVIPKYNSIPIYPLLLRFLLITQLDAPQTFAFSVQKGNLSDDKSAQPLQKIRGKLFKVVFQMLCK